MLGLNSTRGWSEFRDEGTPPASDDWEEQFCKDATAEVSHERG